MSKRKGLMDRIGDAMDAARSEVQKSTEVVQKRARAARAKVERQAKSLRAEVESGTAKAERELKHGVKQVATRVRQAAIES